MNRPLFSLIGAFVSGIAYAFVLMTKPGRKADEEHTWFVTVIGVMLTLGWVASEDSKAAKMVFSFFVATGLPLIARALYIQSQQLAEVYERGMRHGPST